MQIKREDQQVYDLLNKCADAEDNGESKYPGMTYEQGVRAGIDWLTGEREENPLGE